MLTHVLFFRILKNVLSKYSKQMNQELVAHLKEVEENRTKQAEVKRQQAEEDRLKRKEEREQQRLNDAKKGKNYTLLAISFAVLILAYLMWNFARRV